MDRRRFVFWVGFGLFGLSERFRVAGFDALAAAAMRSTEPGASAVIRTGAEHWTVGGNKKWRWLERESLVKGEWVLTGRTTPINKETGERKTASIAYLDDSLAPPELRGTELEAVAVNAEREADLDDDHHDEVVDLDPQLPSKKRRVRHGRPPSKWLRSLNANEIQIWLKTVEIPEAGVCGMTVWMHLTRDHSFDELKIEGLTEDELNKLHAAAHYGY